MANNSGRAVLGDAELELCGQRGYHTARKRWDNWTEIKGSNRSNES